MAEKQQLIKIVRELQSGNKNMAAVLYETYYRDLHYYILKRVNDPEKAEALTKDTFIEIYENVGSLKDAKHFVEWSRQLADRRCEEYRRARRALLSEKVGGAVLDSVEEERKEIHLDADDVSYSTETKRRSGFKNGARLLESIARKVIVGVVAALILTMIKESGIDWLYMGGVFESAEEESTTQSENTENTEEESFVDDTEQIELTEVQTNTESENDKSSSAAETESESATTEAEIQPTEPEETQSPSTPPEPTEAEPTMPEHTEVEPVTPEPTKTEPATPEATKPEPTTQVVVVPEETEAEEMVQLRLRAGEWHVEGIGTYKNTDIVIPETYEDLPVVYISFEAFARCADITSVTLPDSIKAIHYSAFSACYNLKNINLPDKIHLIGESAFNGCYSLEKITLPSHIQEIMSCTFYACNGLTSIEIPETILSIGDHAFYGCIGLTEIIIPASVKHMSEGAFAQCHGLEKIYVEEANPIYYSKDNCLITKASKKLMICCNNSVIPMDGSVTSIGDYACTNCTEWTEVTIPDGVTRIGDYAFDLLKLHKITIPASVTSIGKGAFRGNDSLKTIIFGGTMEQWMTIEKGIDWIVTTEGTATVYCIDGEITGYGKLG